MTLHGEKGEKGSYIKDHVLENKAWYKDYFLIILVIALMLLFSILNPNFIGIYNLFSILRYTSILGLIALGMLVALVVGCFDLSAAAIANFTSLIAIILLVNKINLLILIVLCILVSVFISIINAFFIITVKVPDFIMTLGMQSVLTGLFWMMTRGSGLLYPSTIPEAFTFIGKHDLANLLPISVVILIVFSIILLFLLEYSPLGRRLYAAGSNPDASQHVGILVEYMKFLGFTIAGIIYGIAGILMASTFGSAAIDVVQGYQLPVITAVLLGLTFLSSNIPNIKGTLISVFLLALLINGFTMVNLPFYWKNTVQGLILIVAIVAMHGRTRKKKYSSGIGE